MSVMFEIEIKDVICLEATLSPVADPEQAVTQLQRLADFGVECIDMDTGRKRFVFLNIVRRNLENVDPGHAASLIEAHFDEQLRLWRSFTEPQHEQLERVGAGLPHRSQFRVDLEHRLFERAVRHPTIVGHESFGGRRPRGEDDHMKLTMDLPSRCKLYIGTKAKEGDTRPVLRGMTTMATRYVPMYLQCLTPGIDMGQLVEEGLLDFAKLEWEIREMVCAVFPFFYTPDTLGKFRFMLRVNDNEPWTC